MNNRTLRRMTLLLPLLSLLVSLYTIGFEYHRRQSLQQELQQKMGELKQLQLQLDAAEPNAPSHVRPPDTHEGEEGHTDEAP